MSNKYPKGSEWRKWDLHIHTPASYDWDPKCKKTNSDIIDLAVEEGISAIAVTDHHTTESIDEIKKLGTSKGLFVIPGVELRTDKGNKKIHIIALFNPTVAGQSIYDNVLCPLGFSKDKVKKNTDEQVYCNFEEACKKIHEQGGLVFLHAGSKSNGIEQLDSDLKALLKTDLAFLVDIFEVNSKKNADDYNNIVFPKINKNIPCVITSDSVDRNKLTYRSGHSTEVMGKASTWIKADPTFEGLRQILYEPDDRVAIQNDNPTPIKSSYSIDSIVFSESNISDELSIKKTELPLNHALVAVVGGKGAGKTALVDLMANCYVDRCETEDRNSFVRRIIDHDPNLETRLTFRDVGVFSKKLKEQKFVEEGQFVYIPQGELENYVGDKSDLDKYIGNLIFESPLVKDTAKCYEYFDAIDKVKNYEEKVLAKNDTIQKLEQKTSIDASQAIEKEVKQNAADLGDIEKQIKELEKVQSKDNIKVAKEKQEAIGKLKARRDDLISARDLIKEAEDFLEEQAPKFNGIIASINELFTKLGIKTQFKEFIYPQVKELKNQTELIKKHITETIIEIEKAQKDLDRFEQSVKKHAKLLEHQSELKVAGGKIKQKSSKLEEEKRGLEQAIVNRNELVKKLLESIILQREKYKEIINTFSSKKDKVLSDLDFIAEIHFDDEEFLRKAYTIVDNRKVNINGDDKTQPLFEEFINRSFDVASGDKNKIDLLIEEMTQLDKLLKTKLKGEPVNTSDFYNFLYGNYMEVSPVVQYKKTDIEKLSLGQKATVLIKIYLAQGDKPIVIDSHDDHLDNEFIMEELVKAIRQAKNFRQVILVSNNGNVVVNSDAEQIIVANRDRGKISYTSGAIEEPFIREKAIKVLEGGTEAFRKRQQKYRINS
jgi:hypothetical protein